MILILWKSGQDAWTTLWAKAVPVHRVVHAL